MSQFLGTHQNRLDAKGRVSVPASFRAGLRAQGGELEGGGVAMILRPSHKHPCIEAWPPGTFGALAAPLERLDLFSEDHDDMASALYADAYPVESDKEGRIVLPEALLAHAGIEGSMTFMGLGRIFQIWQPEAAEKRREEARERAREKRLTLPGQASAA
jgi:MraZ protein